MTNPHEIEFEHPPVVEVVCGMQTKLIGDLRAVHIGLLWHHFASEYPCYKEQPPLPQQVDIQPNVPTLVALPGWPFPRIWFTTENESEIVQIQQDRFVTNWKRVEKDQEYPRFDNVFATFKKQKQIYENFVRDVLGGSVTPVGYELVYVNQIPAGEGWSSYEDLGKVLPDLAWRSGRQRLLTAPDLLNVTYVFHFPNENPVGRIFLNAVSAKRLSDEANVIQLTITAKTLNEKVGDIDVWFAQAHNWVTGTFVDMTGTELQKDVWRKCQKNLKQSS